MRTAVFLGGSLVAVAASLFAPRPAHACGGCFAPPQQVTVVTGHRMAFSISPQQSVLWDQIVYSGSPQDFAWVLPVRAGARVELSHDEFFAALDGLTNPVITGPRANCGGGGFACGASSASNDSYALPGSGNGVQVVSQSVVGPYDTVTVRSTNPNALYDWLVANQYDIPGTIRPVIDAYVSEGFDFLALRLAPGQGVQAMKPVRVITPGAGLSLPLRMVAAGVGANVGITLYVLSDGRYQAHNFANGVVDVSKLVWVPSQNQSNYTTLAQQVMLANGGRTWLTEYAQTVTLQGSAAALMQNGQYYCGAVGSPGNVGNSYYGPLQLAGLYYSQCVCAGAVCPQSFGPVPVPFAGAVPDASDDASLDALLEGAADGSAESAVSDAGSLEGAVADGAVPDASSVDASDDGNAGPLDASGGVDGAGDAACTASICAGFDDLDVASVGLDPNNTWVTRLRAILPVNALTEGDLVLEAASAQSPVSSQLAAVAYDDPTYDPCPNGGGCAAVEDAPTITGRTLVAGSLAFLGFALVRRRRR
jgi:hypothetical protein